MTRNHILYFLTFLVVLSMACSYGQHEPNMKKTADNLYSTDKDDQPMNQAMETARRRFSKFDSAFDSGTFDKDKFSIKVRFPNPSGNEYIWLVDITKVGDHYWGVVSDTPEWQNK